MESNSEQNHASNLQELASKSWNLELIISGAAIFLVSYLPGQVDNLLEYYLQNLAPEPQLTKSALPILVYCFFKVITWVLIGTFVIHFVLRAFWVGLVGLHAVFPKGIQYDNLPWQTELSREIGEKDFGQFSDYIHRIDRLSNQIFSFAFLIALMGIGISLIYLVIFLLTNPNVFPEWLGSTKVRSLIFLFLVVALALWPLIALLVSRRPAWLAIPWLRRITIFSIKYSPTLILPLVYRPLTYLNLIYSSNISRKRFFAALTLVTVVVMGGVIAVFVGTLVELQGRDPFVRQAFFGKNNSTNKLFASNYDKLREPGDFLPAVTIESDIVEGPVLRVFVSYRKWLDKSLEQFCAQPDIPTGLTRNARRIVQDSANLDCLTHFFQLFVNDTVCMQADWFFYTQPETGSHGLLGYIPTDGFRAGKNILTLRIPKLGKVDALQIYGQVPFWFYRERPNDQQ